MSLKTVACGNEVDETVESEECVKLPARKPRTKAE